MDLTGDQWIAIIGISAGVIIAVSSMAATLIMTIGDRRARRADQHRDEAFDAMASAAIVINTHMALPVDRTIDDVLNKEYRAAMRGLVKLQLTGWKDEIQNLAADLSDRLRELWEAPDETAIAETADAAYAALVALGNAAR